MKTLTLGNYRHTVTVIRSLARAGHHVIVGREEERTFTQFSRYTSEVWDHPKVSKESAFVQALAELLARRPDIEAVFPIGEDFLECIGRNLAALDTKCRFIMTQPSVVHTCLNKAGIHQVVTEAGIPVPASSHASNLAELTAAATRLGFPCIVKPNRSFNYFFDKKAIICNTLDELEHHFTNWPSGNDCLVIQQYIAGYRPNCHFAAIDGRLVSYFEHNVIRTDRLDDTGFEVDGVSVRPTPRLREYCDSLIRRLGYTGVGCVQFLAEAKTGNFYFLEINPRLDATCALPYNCGFDFPRMAIDVMDRSEETLSQLVKNSGTYPLGRRAYWLLGDIQGLLHGVADGTVNTNAAFGWIGQSLKALAAADLHLTFSFNDPKPATFLYYKLLTSPLRRFSRMSKLVKQKRAAPEQRIARAKGA